MRLSKKVSVEHCNTRPVRDKYSSTARLYHILRCNTYRSDQKEVTLNDSTHLCKKTGTHLLEGN